MAAAGCVPHPSIYADNQPSEMHDIRVLTGDHLVIDGRDLVLADAQAPKPGGEAVCRAEAVAGGQAVQAARTLLAGARHLEIHPASEGRALVNADGLDLGLALIDQGVAVPRGPESMDWCLRLASAG
jgi:hypothetical protein